MGRGKGRKKGGASAGCLGHLKRPAVAVAGEAGWREDEARRGVGCARCAGVAFRWVEEELEGGKGDAGEGTGRLYWFGSAIAESARKTLTRRLRAWLHTIYNPTYTAGGRTENCDPTRELISDPNI